MSEINKSGILDSTISSNQGLINNFTLSNSTSGWTLGNCTLSNGTAILTGANPVIISPTFSVGANDIIAFEFEISLPTPSTTTSGPGLYLGTKSGDSTTYYPFNFTTNTWGSGTTNNNPYFIYSYNYTANNHIKTYILGNSVDINDVPWAQRSVNNVSVYALKVPNSTTYLRSGYNSNTSMIIHFRNPKIYKINHNGICETDDEKQIGTGYVSFDQIIEY